MTRAHDSSGCTNRQSWARAVAFAIVSSGIGTFGHAFALGAAPSYGVLAAAIVLLALYARCFSSQRVGAASMLVAVTVAQLLVHAVVQLSQPTIAHMHHAGRLHQAMVHAGAPTTLMLLVHVVAILTGVGVLLRLDAAIWSRAREGIVRLAAHIRGAVRPRSRACGGVAQVDWALVTTDDMPLHIRSSACLSHRGPPRIATTLRA